MATIKTFELTKSDWKKLGKVGLTDGGEGNGFANTTKNFDNNISCGSRKPTLIRVGGNQLIFAVMYVDGCFYPVWWKQWSGDINYGISKQGEILAF